MSGVMRRLNKVFDELCPHCAHVPIVSTFAVIGAAGNLPEDLRPLEYRIAQHDPNSICVVDGFFCVLLSLTCHNPSCEADSKRSALEKLALQGES